MKVCLALCLAFVFSCLFVSAQDGEWSKSITPEKEDTLVVYVDPGKVTFSPWDKNEIHVTASGLSAAEYESILFAAKNKEIRLDYRGNRQHPGNFEIQIPAKWSLDVYASGDIDAKGKLDGKLRFKAAEGSVTLGDIAGSLSIECVSGDVVAGKVDGSGVIVANADLDVAFVGGELTIKNNDGETSIKSVGGTLNAQTADGDISVAEIKGNASLRADDGDIDVRRVSGTVTMNSVGGDIGLIDASGMVVVSTTSGEIFLRKVSGAVDAKSEDGDISAELNSGNGSSSRFITRAGDIDLRFSPESKVTVEVRTPNSAGEVVSDFKPKATEKRGTEVYRRYELNGGGDTVQIESGEGEVQIKKAVPESVRKD